MQPGQVAGCTRTTSRPHLFYIPVRLERRALNIQCPRVRRTYLTLQGACLAEPGGCVYYNLAPVAPTDLI